MRRLAKTQTCWPSELPRPFTRRRAHPSPQRLFIRLVKGLHRSDPVQQDSGDAASGHARRDQAQEKVELGSDGEGMSLGILQCCTDASTDDMAGRSGSESTLSGRQARTGSERAPARACLACLHLAQLAAHSSQECHRYKVWCKSPRNK